MLQEVRYVARPSKFYPGVTIVAGDNPGEFFVNNRFQRGARIANTNTYLLPNVIRPGGESFEVILEEVNAGNINDEIANQFQTLYAGSENVREGLTLRGSGLTRERERLQKEKEQDEILDIFKQVGEDLKQSDKQRIVNQAKINEAARQAADILKQQTKAENQLYAQSAIERLRQRVNPRNSLVSDIFHIGSKIEVSLRERINSLWDRLGTFKTKLDTLIPDNNTRVILYGLAITLILDILQSQISGETVLMKLVRAPARLINWLNGISNESAGLYFKDIGGERIYYNDENRISNVNEDEIAPPEAPEPKTYVTPLSEIAPAPSPVTLIAPAPAPIPLNQLEPPLSELLPPISNEMPGINNMYKAQEYPDSPVLPSQPGTVPETAKISLNDLQSLLPISGTDPEEKAYRELVLGLRRIYGDVMKGKSLDPLSSLGYIEPIQREIMEPQKNLLNNVIHRAPQHNKQIEQKQATLFNIPNQSVLDPQTIINNMKAKKGTKYTKIIGKASDTAESTAIQSRRLEKK